MASDDALNVTSPASGRTPKLCAWPGETCRNAARRNPNGQGRPSRYCEQDVDGVNHNKDTAFVVRQSLDTVTPERRRLAAVPGEGRARPASRARMTLVEQVAELPSLLQAQQAQLGQHVADVLAALHAAGNPELTAIEISALEAETRQIIEDREEQVRQAEEGEQAARKELAEKIDLLRENDEITQEARARAQKAEDAVKTMQAEVELLQQDTAAEIERITKEQTDKAKQVQDAAAAEIQRITKEQTAKVEAAEQAARDAQRKSDEAIREAGQRVAQAEALVQSANTEAERLRTEVNGLRDQLATQQTSHDTAMQALRDQHQADLARQRTEANDEAERVRAEHRTALKEQRDDHQAEITRLREAHRTATDTLTAEHTNATARIAALHQQEVTALTDARDDLRARAERAERELDRLRVAAAEPAETAAEQQTDQHTEEAAGSGKAS